MSKKIVQTAGRDQLGDFAPAFAHLNDDVLFGKVWNEEAIDVKTKCIVTVVSLMASGITDSSLGYHLQNAKNNGVMAAFLYFPTLRDTRWRAMAVRSKTWRSVFPLSRERSISTQAARAHRAVSWASRPHSLNLSPKRPRRSSIIWVRIK